MSAGQKKIVVQLKVNHDGNAIPVIDSLFVNTVKPDLVFLDVSPIEYPHRIMEVPYELVECVEKNPRIKFLWNKWFISMLGDKYTVVKCSDDIVPDKKFIENEIAMSQQKSSGDFDVIVSVTSFPSRLRNFNLMVSNLDSLVHQVTKYKYHIVITLFKDDIQVLSEDFLAYCRMNDIEILPCEEDLKGNKKYFYVMQKWEDLPIIVVDDDVIFYDNLVESLMDRYLEDSGIIWTGWCQVMNIDDNGKLKYDDTSFVSNSSDETPSFRYKFGSGSGTIIPPYLIDDFSSLLELIKRDDNIFHDELVLKKLSLDKGVKVGLCLNRKYKCRVGGWLTHTQFIENEIQPLVEAKGNLHTINCSKVMLDGIRRYRGMVTEMKLFEGYRIYDQEVSKE